MASCYRSQASTETEFLRKRECQDHLMLTGEFWGFTIISISSVRRCRVIRRDQHLFLELLLWLAEAETKWGNGEVTSIDSTICHDNCAGSQEEMYITIQGTTDAV